jgi:DNA replication protein DnaC
MVSARSMNALGSPRRGSRTFRIALGIEACLGLPPGPITTAAALVNELLEARDDRPLSKVVARYARVELLILDERASCP